MSRRSTSLGLVAVLMFATIALLAWPATAAAPKPAALRSDRGVQPGAAARHAVTGQDLRKPVMARRDSSASATRAVDTEGRVLPTDVAGLVPIVTPLLDFCGPGPALRVYTTTAVVQGRIVDPLGHPLANVTVQPRIDVPLVAATTGRADRLEWIGDSVTTNADGWYVLPGAPIASSLRLEIRQPGFVAAVVRIDAGAPGYHGVELEPIDALVAERELAPAVRQPDFEGVLTDADGRPLAEWWVGPVEASSQVTPAYGLHRYAAFPVRTDRDGRFTFAGLDHDEYRLEAWRADNTAVGRTDVIHIEAVRREFQIATCDASEVLRGRVLDVGGRPIAGASIGLARPSAWAVPGIAATRPMARTETAADGTFTLPASSDPALELRVDAPGIVPTRIAVGPELRATESAIVVARRRWLERPTVPLDEDPGLLLSAVDRHGHPLAIWKRAALTPGRAWPLADVRSLGFAADAAAILLHADGRELGRLWLVDVAPR